MDAATLRQLQDTIKIIASELGSVLDNNNSNHDRAESAACVFHGFVAVAIFNDEVTLEWIDGLRGQVKLITDALDLTESVLRDTDGSKH